MQFREIQHGVIRVKAASTSLINLINSGANYGRWECYTIAMQGGGTLRYTSAHFPISYGGNLFAANGPLVGLEDSSGARAHYKVGLDVDTWNLTIKPRDIDPMTGVAFPDSIGSQPFLAAAAAGALDGATVTIERAYFAEGLPQFPVSRAGASPLGTMVVFAGLVSSCDIQNGQVDITVSDHRSLLGIQMPRNIYQAGCEHMLFDAGCKLDSTVYRKTAAVTAVSSRSQFTADPGTPLGSGDYTLGRVKGLTGSNTGYEVSVRQWDSVGHVFYMLRPFPFTISIGDTFRFLPGCAKTMAACTAFGNLINFGGDPYIPPPETTSGL